MTLSYSLAGSPRRTSVFGAIIGLHLVFYLAVVHGLRFPAPPPLDREPPPLRVIPRVIEPDPVEMPGRAELVEGYTVVVERPDFDLPDLDTVREQAPQTGSGPDGEPTGSRAEWPAAEYVAAALRTPDARLAALIDSCYPASARRLGEEGKAVARVTIGPRGQILRWSIQESSGFPQLDEAMDCVMRRISFRPARQGGQAVESEILLPVVFRLR